MTAAIDCGLTAADAASDVHDPCNIAGVNERFDDTDVSVLTCQFFAVICCCSLSDTSSSNSQRLASGSPGGPKIWTCDEDITTRSTSDQWRRHPGLEGL